MWGGGTIGELWGGGGGGGGTISELWGGGTISRTVGGVGKSVNCGEF